jgi:hypothetical protein
MNEYIIRFTLKDGTEQEWLCENGTRAYYKAKLIENRHKVPVTIMRRWNYLN